VLDVLDVLDLLDLSVWTGPLRHAQAAPNCWPGW
jgi:hypothetical protein